MPISTLVRKLLLNLTTILPIGQKDTILASKSTSFQFPHMPWVAKLFWPRAIFRNLDEAAGHTKKFYFFFFWACSLKFWIVITWFTSDLFFSVRFFGGLVPSQIFVWFFFVFFHFKCFDLISELFFFVSLFFRVVIYLFMYPRYPCFYHTQLNRNKTIWLFEHLICNVSWKLSDSSRYLTNSPSENG